jgi:hypothetical protein
MQTPSSSFQGVVIQISTNAASGQQMVSRDHPWAFDLPSESSEHNIFPDEPNKCTRMS